MATKATKPDTETTDAPEGNDTLQANADQPEANADPTPADPTPTDPFGIGAVIDAGYFPSRFLATGHRARRRAWAPGYELLAASAGGRTGQKLRLMTTGGRGGQVEWKPTNMADELMADDWEAILAKPLDPPEED